VRLVVTQVVTDCCAGDAKLDIGVEVDMGATPDEVASTFAVMGRGDAGGSLRQHG